MRVASFDIGLKNFSFCIEEIDIDILKNIKNIPLFFERYNKDGTISDKFIPILNDICKCGKIITLTNNDISQNCDNNLYLDTQCFYNLNELLDKYENEWELVDIFIIEKQMSFGKKYNTMALKLGQHVFSYFTIHFGKSKRIIEFPAYYKTQILGAQKEEKILKSGKINYKAIDKPKRKKWAITEATKILELRSDDENVKLIKGSKKKDDLSDVIVQLQAFKILFFIDKKLYF
tara:strand:+ start:4258 stop:4956 length:699 start_codon:yes stop_codon:yes gene_type:complete